MKNKIIKFRPWERFSEYLKDHPVTAVSKVPKWYKDMSKFIDNKKGPFMSEGVTNLTLKMCPPFLDAMTSGYMIVTPMDILVEKISGKVKFSWNGEKVLVEQHDRLQFPGLTVSDEFYQDAYKFNTTNIVETPPGYSLLYTHPLNRVDLPFLSFSGVVDTDSYKILPINIPFLIKKDFEGIIEKGTPISQIIPIKRENWKNVVEPHSKEKSEFALIDLKSTIIRSYKNRWWNKKTYN